MESTTLNTNRLIWIIAATGLCVTLVAFQKQQKQKTRNSPSITNTDTIPKKKELKIRDLDEALEDLDDIRVHVDLDNLNTELAKIGPEVEKAVAKARIEVAKAVKEIDVAAISKEINEAVSKVDFEQINKEVNEALTNVKEINLGKIDVDMEKVNAELKKIKPELEEKLVTVKVEVEKVRKELKEYKAFVDGLNNDGLIDKKGEYTIKHKNGELIINGKVQAEPVYNKYRSFLEKHKTLTIERSDDDFNIDID